MTKVKKVKILLHQNEIQELSKSIQYTIEKKIEDLVKKREGLGQQIKEILDNKLKNHEK